MKFSEVLNSNRFSVVAALPSNDPLLVKAALEGGAQSVKCHCNVWHRASGHTFGSFEENRAFFAEAAELCGQIPFGVVPGADSAFVTEEEYRAFPELGIGYVSAYLDHAPAFLLNYAAPEKMLALSCRSTPDRVSALNRTSYTDVVELSIQKGEDYGKPLNCDDLLRYSLLANSLRFSCIVPTQKRILPSDIRQLCGAGIKGLMIGAIVFGADPTPETVKRVTASYRESIEAL